MISRELLDPTAERTAAKRERAARPTSLMDLKVGLLDISKARGDIFLDQLASRLSAQGATIVRFRKPTFTKVCPTVLGHEILQSCNAIVEALAD